MKHTRIGSGKVVHAVMDTEYRKDFSILCGQAGRGNGQVRFKTPRLNYTKDPVTCAKCLAMLQERTKE